jgi:hypothetical protein
MAAAAGLKVEFEVDRDGDAILVRAKTDREGDRMWWIDEHRDWNVTRTRIVSHDGQIQAETEFDLKLWDGRWFPSEMRQYRGSAADGDLYCVFRFIAAEFNRPEHPAELTPASIGFEPGMTLVFMNGDAPVPGPVWDGERIVPMSEFVPRVRAGETSFGPTIQREGARAEARMARQRAEELERNSTWKHVESAWERYTREFIGHYRLNDEQSQHAWTLCRACQARAREYVDRRRGAFEKLEREPDDKQRAELLGPLDEIFEKRLRPRLEEIPNSAQRAAAAKKPPIPEPPKLSTTKPAKADGDPGAVSPGTSRPPGASKPGDG